MLIAGLALLVLGLGAFLLLFLAGALGDDEDIQLDSQHAGDPAGRELDGVS